ncbi:MAG: hypothetical protein CUN49_00365 [Candidatus Thermofonsia Clade 1 bacterium]|uniref:Uncharacterized protein n=1 Tax=Candidatus Thermofonsia Clade 1 bacterium TaxID=2364210 RepID=A0A2M8PIP1_9CHLR|nr:MAG: hypothetical protein CUN49_00365 [Candidatus Thermofonsia Clade 1 bacterium]
MIAFWTSAALFTALIGYYATWINHQAAALSANAFDLAEWIGIIPAVRYAEPPLSAPLALRAALVCLAWLFALRAVAVPHLGGRLALNAIGLGLALSLRPPIAFFRGETGDPNYQQLAVLCLVALLGIALINLSPWRAQRLWLALPLALIGAVCALLGLRGALEALARLQIPTPLGAGSFLYIAGIGLHGALCLWSALRARSRLLGM